MLVSMEEILKNPMFSQARVMAGENGLNRKIKRVSVFDCAVSDTLLERRILSEGDLFITCLEQFKHETESIKVYFDTLIQTGCAGLFVVTADMLHVLTDEVLETCDRAALPVVLIPEDYPYAVLIDTVNKYIAMDNINAMNSLKLEKIMYGNISASEKMEVLYSINPDVRQYLRVINIQGSFNSDIAQMELHIRYLNQQKDIYVRMGNYMTFIISEDSERALRHHSDATVIRLQEFLEGPVIGYSRLYPRKDIGNALEEAKRALETAKAMDMTFTAYEPMSVMQLLLAVRDTQEAHDFYEAYVKAIAQNVSAESLHDILLTMETFVARRGNFQETAEIMRQHENTIRYRVNKVKAALNMENDNVKFNETVAVAVKLRSLIGEKL